MCSPVQLSTLVPGIWTWVLILAERMILPIWAIFLVLRVVSTPLRSSLSECWSQDLYVWGLPALVLVQSSSGVCVATSVVIHLLFQGGVWPAAHASALFPPVTVLNCTVSGNSFCTFCQVLRVRMVSLDSVSPPLDGQAAWWFSIRAAKVLLVFPLAIWALGPFLADWLCVTVEFPHLLLSSLQSWIKLSVEHLPWGWRHFSCRQPTDFLCTCLEYLSLPGAFEVKLLRKSSNVLRIPLLQLLPCGSNVGWLNLWTAGLLEHSRVPCLRSHRHAPVCP